MLLVENVKVHMLLSFVTLIVFFVTLYCPEGGKLDILLC